MGESRTELLAWVNDLLQLNYTKVEQTGTGAAYCQIMDSVFNDVHMTKVKFDTKHEYEYVANYKVLQHTFDKHKIDKIIPVDKLMKCKFQDNLEFMQWVKRYWDQNFPGGAYDAVHRRKGGAATNGGGNGAHGKSPAAARAAVGAMSRKPMNTTNTAGRSASRTAVTATGRASSAKSSAAGTDAQSASVISDLNKQITELKVTVDGLEKERDFYFGKLREIEILVQEQLELTDQDNEDTNCIKDIQAILYRTEEGFEVPPEGEDLGEEQYDDETF
ncbi:calponin homology domain-containing protein [Mucor mucedo]|uniref:calponin homology domain-containing protein n=1 Tax=Mucor mucedo TaxID=29922 RepID=UPI00221FD017|nr:calponin homology domain-containing protein [Mucor mucedo]KAI7896394.1 calponin homology domain-containing protein [Mucor mucedo]